MHLFRFTPLIGINVPLTPEPALPAGIRSRIPLLSLRGHRAKNLRSIETDSHVLAAQEGLSDRETSPDRLERACDLLAQPVAAVGHFGRERRLWDSLGNDYVERSQGLSIRRIDHMTDDNSLRYGCGQRSG